MTARSIHDVPTSEIIAALVNDRNGPVRVASFGDGWCTIAPVHLVAAELDRRIPVQPAAPAVSGWQPIETAPKDVPILVWRSGWGEYPRVFTLHDHGWRGGSGGLVRNERNTPTHWMPLPEVPK